MKKTITFLFAMSCAITMFAQQAELNPMTPVKHTVNVVPNSVSGVLTPTDTILMDDFFALGQASIYGNQGGGYVFGTNVINGGAGCNTIAQGYIMTGGNHYGIEEVLIWVGAIEQVSANGSDLTCSVRSINGVSTYTLGSTNYSISCPNTILSTTTIPWSAIDTAGNWTIATFTTPVYVDADYAVAIDMSACYTNSDTIGFVSSADGGGSAIMGAEYGWWKYGTKWYQTSHVYSGIDNALAFFPVVDANYVGIESDYFANGIKLSQCNPNPVDGLTTIPYSIENDSKVVITIFDVRGNIVMTIDEGSKQNGTYAVTFDASLLSSGTYYYSLTSDGNRLTKKMIVKH